MAQPVKDSFLDLEKHRRLLEENIERLRKSLQHWQTWEAEYEGLKEEILAASPAPTGEQLLDIGRNYEGILVTKKEVDDILGVSMSRNAAQVVNLLDRRLDYVEPMVRTVQKQLDMAEHKLVSASIISTPEVRNEDGLPISDIVEKLDEDGNIISSEVITPGSSKPQLLEVLEKAGVRDLPEGTLPDYATTKTMPATSAVSAAKKDVEEDAKNNSKPDTSRPKPKIAKKGVKFTEDTKSGPEVEKSQTAKRIEDIMSIAKRQATPLEPPVIPTDESPDDAALRQEMLKYGMSEVGAVVAELELEDSSDWSDGDYDRNEMSDDEDQYGRSKHSWIDDQYRQQMIELEERLGVRAMQNIGNKDLATTEQGLGQVKISTQDGTVTEDDVLMSLVQEAEKTEQKSSMKNPMSSERKSVKFASGLDISPTPIPISTAPISKETIAAPVSDIVERLPTTAKTAAGITSEKKASRFKAARAAKSKVVNGPLATSTDSSALPLFPAKPYEPRQFSTPIVFQPADERTRVVPSGPEGKPLVSRIVERDVDSSAKEPDEFDDALMQQQVALEYHTLRNRMLQREGGFMKKEEGEIVPLTEEEGGPKKVSRFKAARLGKP